MQVLCDQRDGTLHLYTKINLNLKKVEENIIHKIDLINKIFWIKLWKMIYWKYFLFHKIPLPIEKWSDRVENSWEGCVIGSSEWWCSQVLTDVQVELLKIVFIVWAEKNILKLVKIILNIGKLIIQS